VSARGLSWRVVTTCEYSALDPSALRATSPSSENADQNDLVPAQTSASATVSVSQLAIVKILTDPHTVSSIETWSGVWISDLGNQIG
jgi:hypothetical protein